MVLNRLVNKIRLSLPTQVNTKNRPGIPAVQGLPQGLDWETLDSICRNDYSAGLSHANFQHLSAWKIRGAYRLNLFLTNGKLIHLIYKESSYDPAEIPGLVDLPVNLAMPEFIIYQQNTDHPLKYLPKVFLAEELVKGMKYRYLLEDLAQDYNRIKSGNEILHICSQFGEIVDALQEWVGNVELSGLIQYDRNFSNGLQEYALKNLLHLERHNSEPVYYQVINHWPDICAIHLSDEFHQYPNECLIHGDSNFSNIHVHQKDESQIKMVDWEWAGFGSPISDFVSLTKGAPDNMLPTTYQRMIAYKGSLGSPFQAIIKNPQQLQRMIAWCRMERGMLDAGFLSAQLVRQQVQAKFSLRKAINRSLTLVYQSYEDLTN
jgi:hypothetical protein